MRNNLAAMIRVGAVAARSTNVVTIRVINDTFRAEVTPAVLPPEEDNEVSSPR